MNGTSNDKKNSEYSTCHISAIFLLSQNLKLLVSKAPMTKVRLGGNVEKEVQDYGIMEILDYVHDLGMPTDNSSSDNGFHIGSFSTDILNFFWLKKSKHLISNIFHYIYSLELYK